MTRREPQVVVVTGASGGIGRATVRVFGARGAKVALLARGEKGLRGAARDVEAAGGTALSIEVDMGEYEQVEAAADRVERELGPIDVWVNVAFTSVFAPFMKIEPAEFRRVTEVSYLGYVYGTRVALDRMVPRDRGAIVQVGSALAYRGIPLQSSYCGAKHAIQGFHEALRCELLHEGSNVPVARLNYTLTGNDKANVAWSTTVITDILHAAGAQDVLTIERFAHLIGGARMGSSPENSVVDANQRMWTVPNVFLSDGSVCPTQGAANPALTIMALASRLAQRMAAGTAMDDEPAARSGHARTTTRSRR